MRWTPGSSRPVTLVTEPGGPVVVVDHEELDALLRWVRSGGEREAAALREEEERQARRTRALEGADPPLPWPAPQPESTGEMAARWLWAVGRFLLETLVR